MADELTLPRGARPIQLDRERFLKFDLAATWLLYKKYGPRFLTRLYTPVPGTDGKDVELNDPETLVFFVWAGLQLEARLAGEELSLEQVEGMIAPFTFRRVFNTLVEALAAAMENPAPPGKAPAAAKTAAAAAPAGPGPAKVSTSMKRTVSLSAASAGRQKSSGGRRSGSTTSRGKGSTAGKKKRG